MGQKLEERLRLAAQRLSLEEVSPSLSHNRINANRRRRWLIALGIAVVCIGVGVGIFWPTAHPNTLQDPFPASLGKIVNFPLYYPSQLPPGFKIDPSSFSATQNAVTFHVIYSSGKKKLLFSLQPNPKNFDFKKFYTRIFKGGLNVETSRGKGRIGELEGMDAASFQAGKTWILITAPAGIDPDPLVAITKSLQPAKP